MIAINIRLKMISVPILLIPYVMKYILLSYAGVGAEGGRVKFAVEIGVDSSLHPYVDRECFEITEAEEGAAGGYFIAYAFDVFESFEGVFIAGFRFDILDIYASRRHFFGCVEYVTVAKTGLGRKESVGIFEYLESAGEGITSSTALARFFVRSALYTL